MRASLRTHSVAVAVAVAVAVLGAAGCATYEQELGRAEQHFSHDEHAQSLATLRALETDWYSFGARDRARYAYLRGMTDYRIGFKADARHWLAIAAQIERENPGSLAATEKQLVEEKLGELNQVVWSGDVLPTEEPPGTKAPKKVEKTEAKDEDADEDKKPKKKKSADDDDSPKPKKKKSDAD